MKRIKPHHFSREEKKLIFLSSIGTAFEWYDFYLYGYLASIIAIHFFAGLEKNLALIFALITFAIGFVFRPLGALLFGSFGDKFGRKRVFVATVALMGVATFLVGLLPTYERIGILAPILLISLRVIQGIALGGEYGGAATYVAEFAPANRRGAYTSWIQITASCGYILSIAVIFFLQWYLGSTVFMDWGWRIPFILCGLMLAVSVFLRVKMQESPVFSKMQLNGSIAKTPIRDLFSEWSSMRTVLIVLSSIIIAQSVAGVTANLYALYFLTEILKLDSLTANACLVATLVLTIPAILFFAYLSDIIGRKKVVFTGCFLAICSYFPAYHLLAEAANPALIRAQKMYPIVLYADKKECSLQWNLLGQKKLNSSCDLAKQVLMAAGLSYHQIDAAGLARIQLGPFVVKSEDASGAGDMALMVQQARVNDNLSQVLKILNYPEKADPTEASPFKIILIITYLLMISAMMYGPIAALLVECFPARIRYTALSFSYHLGNAIFAGFLPVICYTLVIQTGNMYAGLWYPCSLMLFSLIVGLIFFKDGKH